MTLDQTDRGPRAATNRLSDNVGRYEWDIKAGSWWWSDSMYRLYGYEPESVEPSMERFLKHKHPNDMARIDAVFDRALSKGGPFSCYHRIIDARGKQRTVVVVGYSNRNPQDTETLSMEGFMVDVTEGTRHETNEALRVLLRTRAGIEQVKGALMLVHGLDDDGAFEVLRSHSQVYNKKLSAVVADLLAMFRHRDTAESISRGELDQMLWDAAH